MFSSRTSSTLVVLLILVTVLGSIASFWWLATRSEGIAFLAEHPGGQWIVYPVPVDLRRRVGVRLDTVFRRRFTLDAVPGEAELRVRGLRSTEVALNGRALRDTGSELPDPTAWRREHRFTNVAQYLKAGENEIVVTVWNDRGPPALWLHLAGQGVSVASDGQWEASYAGAVWRPARLATALPQHHMADATGDPSGPEMPTTVESLRRQWPALLTIAGIAALVVAGAAAARRRWGGRVETEAFLLSGRRMYWVLAVVAAAWIVLFTHNLKWMPPEVGFDIGGHTEYLKTILDEGRLPLAEDGWQGYQPPLFYLLAAAVLKVGGLAAGSTRAEQCLGILTMSFGIAQVLLVFGCVRQLFPDSPRRQLLGLAVAAALPVHLYLYHYATNEGLCATLVTASLYLTLRIINMPSASWRWYAALGLCLGAAMLAKFSALVALGVIAIVLVGRLVAARQWKADVWTRTLGVTMLVGALVCGWHFVRVWLRYGRPIVGNWDAEYGHPWWQDAGYHTARYYLSFGRALIQPFFAGLYGFADALYSTFWGDGFVGGGTSVRYSPTWNWELMSAGYLLALALVAAGLVGLGAAVVRLVRRPSAAWMLVLGTAAATLLSLIYITLKLPYYGQAKAFYGMAAVAPIVACIAWGLDLAGRRWLAGRALIWTVVLTLCGCSLAAFWIRADSADTHRVSGAFLGEAGRVTEALPYVEAASRLDPEDADALFDHGRVLAVAGRVAEAEALYHRALELNPNFAECRVNLALLLNAKGDREGALGQTRLAVEEDPDFGTAWQYRSLLLLSAGRADDAVETLREAVRVSPHDPRVHRELAALLAAQGDKAEARRHADYARRLSEALSKTGRNP
ncbi:MAG: tetratricopeptide repeat protein [Planctomycetes bacterium]|nr:tetratricopeptide repeat protein [Planctomycetota bacterium]